MLYSTVLDGSSPSVGRCVQFHPTESCFKWITGDTGQFGECEGIQIREEDSTDGLIVSTRVGRVSTSRSDIGM